jgi:hypothetical protein
MLAEKEIDCNMCERVMKSGTPCDKCLGMELWPANHDPIEIYQSVRILGKVTFEGIDRALERFEISGVEVIGKIHIVHAEFRDVEFARRQQATNKGKK